MSTSSLDGLVYRFNVKPDTYVDHSWLDPIVAPIWNELPPPESRGAAISAHLSRWLFASGRLPRSYDFDFSSVTQKRIFLLDKAALSDIAYTLGLALFSAHFRQLISKRDRIQLLELLGERDYAFMHDFVFPWPQVGVVGSTKSGIHELISHAPAVGTWALMSSFAGYSACTARALLKLPRDSVPFKPPRALKDARAQRIWDFVIHVVINERHPQWRWLF
jgi:hypothetical protein